MEASIGRGITVDVCAKETGYISGERTKPWGLGRTEARSFGHRAG